MRLIDADALIEKTDSLFKDLNSTEDFMGIGYNHGVGDSIATIKNAPTIEPVKTGKWIYDNQFHWYRASCSECGYMRATDIKADNWNFWKYCPNCGAKMENE